ncbi:hypothetical protein AAVH_20881 [Aphelenchoides avenae]|nr:hypothetical protein AAVH_20881 [Aphelenchus avenae]
MPSTLQQTTQVYLQYRLPSTSRNFPTFLISRSYRMSTICLNQPSYRLMCQCWLPSLVGLASPERLVRDNYTTAYPRCLFPVEPLDAPAPQEPNVPGLAQPPCVADVPQGQNVLDGIKVEPLEDPVPDVPRAPDTQPDLAAEANAGDSVASGTNGLKIRED